MQISKITKTCFKANLKNNTIQKENNNLSSKTIRIEDLNSDPVANLNKASISFCGSNKFEKSNNTQISTINHQTAFFREADTDEFVQNYIRENFSSQDEIKIVSGACSNGEEAKSYSMMLDDLDNVEISGFDIDQGIVDEANSANPPQLIQYCDDLPTALESEDIFFKDDTNLTSYQRRCKEKFSEYYSIGDSTRQYINPDAAKQIKEIEDLLSDKTKLKEAKVGYEKGMEELKKTNPEIAEFLPDYSYEEMLEESLCVLKKQAESYNTIFDCKEKKEIKNCNFKQGDVMNLSELYQPNSVDVLLYRNALYHNLCFGDNILRAMREDSTEIMTKIAQEMNKVVKTGGLVVFGEDEFIQGIDTHKVADIMQENGFELIESPKADNKNIWKKVKDNN